MKPWIAVLVSLVLGACASTLQTPTSPTQPLAGTQATRAAAIAPSAVVPAAPESEMAHWAKSYGYRQVKVRQRILWCKEEVTLGSRIPQQTCATEDQLARYRAANEQNKQALLNSTSGCPNGTCARGN
jgi:hypothetical protein